MRIASNKTADIFRFAHAELEHLYTKEEIDTFMFIFFEEFLGWNKATVLAGKDKNVNQSDLLKFNFGIKDMKNEKPIQYIIGKTSFYGLDFAVNEHTLIPRQETEELVSLIIKENSHKKELSILDIGTGSGCIAVTLSKYLPETEITGIDISKEAIETAQLNAEKNEVKIHFQKGNIFSKDLMIGKMFDIIVSNPPYVCDSEKELMQNNVLMYEPHTALFVSDDDPLIFYDAVSSFTSGHLKSEGRLYFEINERFGEEIQRLLSVKGFSSAVIKDMNRKDRICIAVKSLQTECSQ